MASLNDFTTIRPGEVRTPRVDRRLGASKILRNTPGEKCLHRHHRRPTRDERRPAGRGRSSVLRSSSTLTTTVTDENDPFGVEAHADQLLHLLNGNVDPNLDFSGTGTSKTLGQIQTASTTVDTISPDFDLYEESCIDAATRSSEQCLSTIAELGTELRTYLLDQFWERFNACIPVLHKTVFLGSLQPFEGQGQGSYGPFCSPELHLAVLAMGLRRANHTRPEVARLLRSGWDSTLHQQLRGAVDVLLQLRKEWKTVDVQAVVILAHLESERGRDHSARVYLDSAFSMIHDIQRRTSHHVLDMLVSDDELIIQRMTVRAASLLHSQWTMFDDRRDGIFSSGERYPFPSLSASVAATTPRRHLHGGNSTLLSLATTTTKNDIDVQVYNAHLELMSIATTDTHESALQQAGYAVDDAFSRLTQLHSRLKRWYAGLPGHLSLDDQTKHSANPSLFLLHQQYHAILILLFRPFASPESLGSIAPTMESADVHQLYVSIRKLMLNSAMQIATMLEESSQRFEIGAIFPLAVQQGALAASVNLSSMMRKEECSMRGSASQHLEFLQRFFSDMSAIQAPAERLLKSLFKLRSLGDGTGIPMQAWQTPGPSQDEDGVGSTEYMHPNADGTPWRREQSEHGHVHGNSFDNAEHQQDKTVSPRAGNSRTAMEQAWGADIIRASGDTTAAVISPSASDPSGAAAGCAPAPQHIRASSNRPERDLGPLTPSLAAADMHIDHFSSNTHDQELPTFPDPAANEWDDADAVSVSWSETFKALGAVNRRTAGEKMSANEFGDVMGCVFQL